MLLLLFLALVVAPAAAIRPPHSWSTLSGMSFFHACNESGPFSDRALDTITKFPLVTVEKGQGFHQNCSDYGVPFPCAEVKIIDQCTRIKKRNASIATVFYYNAVLDWYFYAADQTLQQHPEWQLNDSFTGKTVHAPGDGSFNPPKGGMLVFDHAVAGLRDWWQSICKKATSTGMVDGCFSDSSQNGTHKTPSHLNHADNLAYENGKVQSMSELTSFFGGEAGKPFAGSTGVLIAKTPDQVGVNSAQIEMFEANEEKIEELMDGVAKGFLMQAHAKTGGPASDPVHGGCRNIPAMTSVIAAFLIGAGDDSYFGSGQWITHGINDVESRWCPELFDRPIGRPTGLAVKAGAVYTRSFESGTTVRVDTSTGEGAIHWAA